MIIPRNRFFLLLAAAIVIPFLLPRILWLSGTRRTMGYVAFVGGGEIGDQMPMDYTYIKFPLGKDTIWFKGLGNLSMERNTPVPVRYRSENPEDARLDIWQSIWGDQLVYLGIPLLMLLLAWVHPEVFPRRAKLKLSFRRPMLMIVPSE